ncbi:MAG: HAD-IIA family hydrolase [Ardenticatenaceae bacterium]
MAHRLNNHDSQNVPSRKLFLLAGLAGTGLALLFSLLLVAVLPSSGQAFLGKARFGSALGVILLLMALGLIVMVEWLLMLFLIVRMARRGNGALLVGTHFAYTFFPVLYGALGGALTGETWWIGVTAFLSVMRFSTSVLINPRQMAEHHANQLMLSKEETISATHSLTEQRQGDASTLSSSPPKRPRNRALNQVQGFILDMDGVLYRGNQVRYGAIEFIKYLNQERIPYVCLTNNSSRTSAMYQEKLDKLRIPIDASCVVGSGQATAEWLLKNAAPGARILIVGEAGLEQEISQRGFTLVEHRPADYVVVGIDFGLTYERLKQAALAIRQNAKFIGTNSDPSYPNEEGLVPGNGAALAFLEAATGVAPLVMGKPQPAIMEIALTQLGLPPEHVAMVGDRLTTDILGGQNAGMITILLRGGVTSDAERIASPIKPDHVFDDLDDLLSFYRKEH